MTKDELLERHRHDAVGFEYHEGVGYAVVRRDAGPPRWIGGGRMFDAALYVRRDSGRPAADFGPMAGVRAVPQDEWVRADADREARYFARCTLYCWTGRFFGARAVTPD